MRDQEGTREPLSVGHKRSHRVHLKRKSICPLDTANNNNNNNNNDDDDGGSLCPSSLCPAL